MKKELKYSFISLRMFADDQNRIQSNGQFRLNRSTVWKLQIAFFVAHFSCHLSKASRFHSFTFVNVYFVRVVDGYRMCFCVTEAEQNFCRKNKWKTFELVLQQRHSPICKCNDEDESFPMN